MRTIPFLPLMQFLDIPASNAVLEGRTSRDCEMALGKEMLLLHHFCPVNIPLVLACVVVVVVSCGCSGLSLPQVLARTSVDPCVGKYP